MAPGSAHRLGLQALAQRVVGVGWTSSGVSQVVAPDPRPTRPYRPLPLPTQQASREANRLQFLQRQADIFQHFAPAAMDKAKKQ